MAAKPRVFIDGEAGTTGLQIRDRLKERDDIALIGIDPAKRKDARERSHLLNDVDVAILCLPDEAARAAVSLVDNPAVKILDASSAHRTVIGWVYGFPELAPGQRERISAAPRVSNPGCYPTGFLACVRPLVAKGLIPSDFPLTVNAVSGYSGGGRQLIETYREAHENGLSYPFGIYGLQFGHKHVKEMHKYACLHSPPLFVPSVGDFAQGMLVQVPLPLWSVQSLPSSREIYAVLDEYYRNEPFVVVMPFQYTAELRNGAFLDVEAANKTNQVQLFVFANDDTREALLIARLDNLGKGASGAAVQNLNLMLGLPESLGLL
jgi:N-acetyl-gamma-glutamyl-phosphate reductase